MRYWLATLLGLGIAAASIALATWGLYGLVRTGTCASGGAYQVVAPCPEGTGLRVGGLVGGIVATLVGAGIYAMRGQGRGGRRGAAGALAMGLLMISLSVASLVAAFGPASTDRADSKLGAAIASFVLLPMGIGPLIYGLRTRAPGSVFGLPAGVSIPSAGMDGFSVGASTVPPAPSPPPAPAPPTGGADAISRLEHLQALRAAKAITDAEFEAKKAEILREM